MIQILLAHCGTAVHCRHGLAVRALLHGGPPSAALQVDLGSKPTEFVELYHSIIPDKDVRERVPVLVNGTNRLVDSTTIVEYLAAAYPDSGTPLAPPDAYVAARVKLFTQYFAVRQGCLGCAATKQPSRMACVVRK